MEKYDHGFGPVFDEHSRILILGSFPSRESRKQNFYYAHKNNRFWPVLAYLFNENVPLSEDEKRAFLSRNKIALWDAAVSCEVTASSDASIKSAIPCDIAIITEKSPIEKIYSNGKTAASIYDRYLREITKTDITVLPSTSPANAAYSFEKLIAAWKIIT